MEAELSIPAGETVALIGPNGSGKSTILESVALAHGGRAALLTQDPALLHHLTALDNVALGPRIRGVGLTEARQIAAAVLAEVGVGELAGRGPREMSGGQRARVALARALAVEPGLLLLDEPTAALDITVAAEIRETLAGVLRGRTAILVTHDVLDLHLAARAVVLSEGRVAEDAGAATLLSAPATPFAQEFVGVNRLDASLTSRPDGTVLEVAGEEVTLPGLPPAPGPAHAYFGAVARLASERGQDEHHLWLRGRVRTIAPALGSVSLALALPDGQRCRVLVSASEARGTGAGDWVWVVVPEVRVVPRSVVSARELIEDVPDQRSHHLE
nr:ATP-binding cassette domain-containing protein [Actinomycetales bacterium]